MESEKMKHVNFGLKLLGFVLAAAMAAGGSRG